MLPSADVSTVRVTGAAERFLAALARRDFEEVDVVRIRWRVAGVDPELGPCMTEQTAYAGLDDGRIAWMNLVCSGDPPLRG